MQTQRKPLEDDRNFCAVQGVARAHMAQSDRNEAQLYRLVLNFISMSIHFLQNERKLNGSKKVELPPPKK